MDESIQQFASITGASTERARFFLEAAGGDLQTAMSSFYESEPSQAEAGAGAEAEAPTNASAAPAVPDNYTGPRTLSGQPVDPSAVSGFGTGSSSASSRPSRPAAGGASRGGISTFRDLQSSSSGPSRRAGDDDDADDHDDGDDMNYFAGGERSALSVENPEARRRRDQTGGDLVQEILRRAAEEGKRHPEGLAAAGSKSSGSRPSASSSSAFTGRGRTINDTADADPSSSTTSMPGSFANRPGAAPAGGSDDEDEEDGEGEVAIRNLTFWQDGFSIEDGELMRYDDPAHAQTLAAINSGHAPLDLLNIRFGQQVHVHVHRRTDEKYKPPPMKAFGGSGNRLGSPAPASFASSSRSQPPAAAAPPAASASQESQVDADKPTTQLQIRLGDGQRMTARLNTHHTIADLRSYINAANPGMSTRNYTLNASFPPKPLADESQTLQEAGLLNAVVIQKFQ
ncbi:related to SHP1-potential regulatory subunit for Glc7p [Sporisorium scitamineum]|uniref:Related to SHP1-potential regulatory subunit for Glc7p n=1 Tax=Sporisorium scitamineum TaxID=49012 RepID=A0A140KNM1_9BASI|nr:related to SHP1-potential regulatory subunit for Glc7p [Sporisorium scitamineum]